jgi:N-methylhydantoinase A
VLKTANSNMETALRKVSVQRGYDPEDFTLIAFGGGGPLHACSLAEALRIKEIVIPPNPGLFSAFGMLCADVVKEFSLTVMKKEEETSAEELGQLFLKMEKRAIEELKREGFDSSKAIFSRFLDMRFRGQSYELTVPFSKDFVGEFIRAHRREYGYSHDSTTEVVNLRLRVAIPTPKPSLKELPPSESSSPEDAYIRSWRTAFGGEIKEVKVYSREKLRPGHIIEGPAIVIEYSSTTVIEEGWTLTVDRTGSLLLHLS